MRNGDKPTRRTKIKCHNNMSGDRAFTNLFRSFNLSDENHLFFSILHLYFTHFDSICCRKGHHSFYVVISVFYFVWFKQTTLKKLKIMTWINVFSRRKKSATFKHLYTNYERFYTFDSAQSTLCLMMISACCRAFFCLFFSFLLRLHLCYFFH